MKKVLLATTVLALSATVAAAEVKVTGNGYMGIGNFFNAAPAAGAVAAIPEDNELELKSRLRIVFTASGETDGGLSFGGSVRADNAGPGASGTAGNVFISGSFGKLSMGDVDGAANALVGHVDGVGYTGLSDFNESTFIGGGTKESALYVYSAGSLQFAASVGQTRAATTPWSVAAKYSIDAYSFALGYEDNDAGTDHVILGASATFSGVTVKANYGKASGVVSGNQWALSATYAMDALSATVFVTDDSDLGGAEAYGLGVGYDLGGGAALKAGYVKNKTAGSNGFDVGVTFSF
jgi:outer membrane protein OmpU